MVSLAAININLTCNLLFLLLYWNMSSEKILQELTDWFPEAQDEKFELMQKFTSQLQVLPLRWFVTPQNKYSIIIALNIRTPFNFSVLFLKKPSSDLCTRIQINGRKLVRTDSGRTNNFITTSEQTTTFPKLYYIQLQLPSKTNFSDFSGYKKVQLCSGM